MMKRARRTFLAGTLAAGMALVGAAASWACTPDASLTTNLNPQAGPPGSTVSLVGQNFPSGLVELRWATATGIVLAQVGGPEFSAAVRVPAVAPGPSQIIAVAYDALGEEKGTKPLAFEVTAPTATAVTQPEPAVGAPAQTSATATGRGLVTAPAASPAPAAPAAAVATDEAAVPAATAVPERPASSNPAAVSTTSGRVVFGGSVPTPVLVPVTDEAQPVPSRRTVSADLWSGFATGDARTSPLLSTEGAATVPDTGSPVGTGLVLLGGAALAMGIGFALSEASRRRATAASRSGQLG